MDKCCGTCKWWEPKKRLAHMGYCDCPIPSSMCEDMRHHMFKSGGKDCPTYQPKEAERATTQD